MATAQLSDQDFIDLWNKLRSATAMMKTTGLDMTTIYRRRRRIEKRYDIQLAADHPSSPTFQVTLPANGVRVNVDIDDGIALVASDAHYWPGIISTAHRAFTVAARELRPKMIVMNGDLFDGATISRHDRIGWDHAPTVKEELQAVSERLDEIFTACPTAKRFWTTGNHDIRFNSRLAAMAGQYEGVKGFTLSDHFPEWIFSTSLMVNDHTMIKHRWHNGVHATYNNVLKSGTSMVTGHLHALQVRPFTDYNGTRYAVDTGTLACPTGEQFAYAEDNPMNHRSGFAVLTFKEGRLLPPELLEVIDEDAGQVFFRGQLITV